MRLGGKKTKAALVVLLLAGFAAYPAGQHLWGRHHYRAAQEALRQRDFRQASLHLEKCLGAWPDDLPLRLLAAQTARRQGDFEEASRQLRVYEQKKGPEQARLREAQLLLVQQGDRAEADLLLESCADTPQASDVSLTLEAVIEGMLKAMERATGSGMNFVQQTAPLRNLERAVALWREKCAGQADRVQNLVWLGRINLLTNQEQEGAACFRKALELAPGHFDARLYLSAALTDSDPREAAGHLESLRGRDPRNSQVCYLLAVFRHNLGQLLEAQQSLDELLAAHPDHQAALLERGKVALDAGRPEEAEGFLRRALALAPDDLGIHLAMTRCLHLTGKEAAAKHHQQRYFQLQSERTQGEQEALRKRRAALAH